jgi:hypothetical protein
MRCDQANDIRKTYYLFSVSESILIQVLAPVTMNVIGLLNRTEHCMCSVKLSQSRHAMDITYALQ